MAMGAVRNELLRTARIDAETSADEALDVLDDLARTEPELVASQWYLHASNSQLILFAREWNKNYIPKRVQRNFRSGRGGTC